jgi:hypothetical protein
VKEYVVIKGPMADIRYGQMGLSELFIARAEIMTALGIDDAGRCLIHAENNMFTFSIPVIKRDDNGK